MENDLVTSVNKVETTETDLISRVFVVRHGESIANTEGIYQGQTYDTDLSELGKKQARSLGIRARELGLKRIIASPLKRTYQTALEISRECDLPIEINNFIIETNHGEWEGKHKSWIEENYHEVYKQWFEKPSIVGFPGGETFVQTFERVNIFLQDTEDLSDTLIVTHDNIVRILVTLANGWTLDEIWRHDIEPAALNFFEFNKTDGKNKIKILKLNDNTHLEGLRADLSKHAL